MTHLLRILKISCSKVNDKNMIVDVIRLNEALENRIFMVFHLNPSYHANSVNHKLERILYLST